MKYTDEKNIQIVLALLKEHGIRKVIASPGTTNIALVASMQHDPYFELYSAADERSAAYIACGLAGETGEAVVLSCTGATASRNYIPALTEAYYRKLPILAITSMLHRGRIGQNLPQIIDRSMQQKDIVRYSTQISVCHTQEDIWACNIKVNQAILELYRDGGGPVHIDIETICSGNFPVENLPKVNPIFRISYKNSMPEIEKGRIGIFVGAHKKWSRKLTDSVDKFCEIYDAVVLCDQTSNYYGKYRVLFSLITDQDMYHVACNNFDLIIHIGDISGAYPVFKSKQVWRVNPDGEIRDTFKNLKYVFEMEEQYFFEYYAKDKEKYVGNQTFLDEWRKEEEKLRKSIPEIPFSNIWIAEQTSKKLPQNSILHLGILNSLRSWNFFEIPSDVEVTCNTGGFGIDGILSTAIGASLGYLQKTVFCVIGDLAFFYDLNSLGNRHIGKNMRILLINNGKGTEFRNYNHIGAKFGDSADEYIAAAGHYGKKSRDLIRHYAIDMGFEYLSAENKEEYLSQLDYFVMQEKADKPIIFEVFTDSEEESKALQIIRNLIISPREKCIKSILDIGKKIIG
ncbi:MAG: thiamine pyrophosphate-binding protein [Oliverpabstia sp.]